MQADIQDYEENTGLSQDYVCDITPTEFEKFCLEILSGYAEENSLSEFQITHNVKIPAHDGIYQIDIYATFMAMGVKFKVLCECKQYSSPVSREKVAVLHNKIDSIGAHKGILLSTSGFQRGAIEYAEAHGIALLRIYDRKCVFLSHSAGESIDDENDPLAYGERQMPRYEAIDYTTKNGQPYKVYPTKSMVRDIYAEMDRLMQKKYGFSLNHPKDKKE